MYTTSERAAAAIAYIPVIGWVYVLAAASRSEFAMFHLRQSIGLFAFLGAALLGWGAVTWLLSWIPFGMLAGVVLFTIAMVAIFAALVAWIMGVIRALMGHVALLPIFGAAANRIRF